MSDVIIVLIDACLDAGTQITGYLPVLGLGTPCLSRHTAKGKALQ